ncbi:hypothetical protein [Companilactobacillus versmoldensis]|uniref:Uncharacterized protein n=1 Tax=Companilactobacillus versmoldensis DSM 14857 = KCTC 3814 TaxID=1423815 RepID=A0A0R1SBV2_9LACO|nr:hypothetical protein [Companilactobacillus versmoldensis]KRL66615.1 hypothetical protein FC27_GL000489 [Companilactobacillus versmoldensis DSM 14857 = KCTC 3814]
MKAIIAMDLADVPIVSQDVTVYTLLTKENKKWADQHKGVGIQFVKTPIYVRAADKGINMFVKGILKIADVPEYNDMLHFVYFSHMVAYYLSQRDYRQIAFEDQILCEKVLLQFGNDGKYIDKVEIL